MSYVVRAAAVLFWAVPSVAFADAIAPPLDDDHCANGARGTWTHCGQHCIVWGCGDDDDCEGGRRCVTGQSLCIEEKECETSSTPIEGRLVHWNCTGGARCNMGTCQEVARVCAFVEGADAGPRDSATDAPRDGSTGDGGDSADSGSGCSCRVGGVRSGFLSLALCASVSLFCVIRHLRRRASMR